MILSGREKTCFSQKTGESESSKKSAATPRLYRIALGAIAITIRQFSGQRRRNLAPFCPNLAAIPDDSKKRPKKPLWAPIRDLFYRLFRPSIGEGRPKQVLIQIMLGPAVIVAGLLELSLRKRL
jgi:hypothetical protein